MKTLVLTFIVFFHTSLAIAQEDQTESPEAILKESISELEAMKKVIDSIKPDIMRSDLGRLLVLEAKVNHTFESVNALPVGHFDVFRAYQDMIITFKYSEDWFRKDFPDDVQSRLVELQEAIAYIQDSRGFNDSPFSVVVADILEQMHTLFSDLQKQNISREFKDEINEVIQELGKAIPIARQGDRPLAFEAGDIVYLKVKALYPYFDKVASSDELFETYMTLQGLNEYYYDAAQRAQRSLKEDQPK